MASSRSWRRLTGKAGSHTSQGRHCLLRGGSRLRVEQLEERNLLAVTIIDESFKTLQFSTADAFSGTVSGLGAYEGTAEASGTLRFDSPTHGEGQWTGHGEGVRWGDPFVTSGSGGLLYDSGILSSQMVVDINSDESYALAASGTLSSSNLEAAFDWNRTVGGMTIVGGWSGRLVPRESTIDLVPTAPFRFGTGAGFGFRLNGAPVSAPAPSAPVGEVDLYWATGPDASDTIGAPIATVPVYWNHAEATVCVDNLGAAPGGATHLVAVGDPDHRLNEADETNNVIALPLASEGLQVTALNSQFKSVSYHTEGAFSGQIGEPPGGGYAGNVQVAGVIDFDSPTQGSGFWMGNGSGVSENFPFPVVGGGDVRYDNGNLFSEFVVDVFQPYHLVASGTLSSSDLHAAIQWNSSLGSTQIRGNWAGTVVDQSPEPLDLRIASGQWLGEDLLVQFEALGPVLSTSAPGTPATSVELYWANGPTAEDIVGSAVASLPVYWNQAEGTFLVRGLRDSAAIGSHLVAIVDREGQIAEAVETNNVCAIPAAPPASTEATAVFLNETYQTLSISTTGHFQGTVTGVTAQYSGTANAAAVLRFQGPGTGTGFWIGGGAGQQGNDSFLFSGRGELRYFDGSFTSRISIDIAEDRPYGLSAAGTLSSQNLAAQFAWDTPVADGVNVAGTWSGRLLPTGSPPIDLAVGSVFMSGSALGLRYQLQGGPLSTANPWEPVNSVEVYWSYGPTLGDIFGDPVARLPVYWNQADATVLVNSLPQAPLGAKYLVVVADRTGVWGEASETNNLQAIRLPTAKVSNPGVYVGQTAQFFLKNQQEGGDADIMFAYGVAQKGWVQISGDWDGDGIDTVGLYDPATSMFFLRNEHAGGDADAMFQFGMGSLGWIPLAGDWDGDGHDTIGLYDPQSAMFFLKNSLEGGDANETFQFGIAGQGWQPLAGNWTGSGGDRVGLYVPGTAQFFLRHEFAAGPAEESFQFGVGGLGWIGLVGDWNGDGVDGPGAYAPDSAMFFLNNLHQGGDAQTSFAYGIGGQNWKPLVGFWGASSILLSAETPAMAAAALAPLAVDRIDLVAEARSVLDSIQPGGVGEEWSLDGWLGSRRRRG